MVSRVTGSLVKCSEARGNMRVHTASYRDRIVYYARIVLTLALIAFEFTNLIPYVSFVAESDSHTAHLKLHFPAYGLEYFTYLVCAIITVLDSRSLTHLLKSRLLVWVYVGTIVFTWSMLFRVVWAPAGYAGYLLMRPFGLRLNALAFMLGCFIVFDDTEVLMIAKVAIICATLLAIVLNVFEVFNPGYFSLDPSRSAGFYGDPNGSGIAIVLGTLVGITVIPKRWREVILLAAGLGVIVTFSRQALLAYAILVTGCVLGRTVAYRKMLLESILVASAVALCLVSLHLDRALSDTGVFNASNVARLKMTLSGASATERADVAWLMWEKFETAPLLGNGFETAGYWTHRQSHDLYLSFMADHGILGVLLLPALALTLLRRAWESYTFCIILLLWQTFDHELFMYAFGLVTIAIQAIECTNLPFETIDVGTETSGLKRVRTESCTKFIC